MFVLVSLELPMCILVCQTRGCPHSHVCLLRCVPTPGPRVKAIRGDATSSRGDAEISRGGSKSSLGDVKSSLAGRVNTPRRQ